MYWDVLYCKKIVGRDTKNYLNCTGMYYTEPALYCNAWYYICIVVGFTILHLNCTGKSSEVEVEDKQDTHMIVTDTINQVEMYMELETEMSSSPQ